MKDPKPSAMIAELKGIGLDPANLPPIEALDKKQKLAVMKTFSTALGIACVDCHASDERFNADTRRKRVAKRMWNEITRLVAFDNGDPVYCDSCHQGAMFVLDRSDKSKVSDYMSDHLVGKMKRTDARDHDCGTCHGDPPDFGFIATWKGKPAPDIELRPAPAKTSVASTPATTSEPLAKVGNPPATTTSTGRAPTPPTTTTARDPSPPATSSTPPPPTPPSKPTKGPPSMGCGDKNDQCPLQAWMRQYVATAVAASDTNALAKALDRVAGMSPDPAFSSWAEYSKQGADAARAGNMEQARKSCQQCHDAYKNKFRASFRSRPVTR
jgi:hypothetical protein